MNTCWDQSTCDIMVRPERERERDIETETDLDNKR